MQPLRREIPPHDYRAELFELIRTRSFGRGKIMLASGRESDFYFDLRPTTIHPAGATCVGELICDALEGTNAEFVGGLEAGAIPIATAVAIASHRRGGKLQAFFVRKKLEGSRRQEDDRGPAQGRDAEGQQRRGAGRRDHHRRLVDAGGRRTARGGREHRVRADDRRPARGREGKLRHGRPRAARDLYGG